MSKTSGGKLNQLVKKVFGNREDLNHFMRFFSFIPDEQYLKLMYRLQVGKKLNLDNPKTYNEKLQWMKIHNRKPEFCDLVDKYEVKKVVSSAIGDEFIIPTLGIWDKFDDINFESLPNQFVLKCTHDSGGVVICKDKRTFDKDNARRILEKSLKCNFYWVAREWPYKNVKPRILAEELIGDGNEIHGLSDYKIFVFNGKARAFYITYDRGTESGTKIDVYDIEGNRLPFTWGYPTSDYPLVKPKNFDLMISLAEKLGEKLPHVRVDFYNLNGKIYFGEMTFYCWSGLKAFVPDEWDKRFGDWIDLSLIK